MAWMDRWMGGVEEWEVEVNKQVTMVVQTGKEGRGG